MHRFSASQMVPFNPNCAKRTLDFEGLSSKKARMSRFDWIYLLFFLKVRDFTPAFFLTFLRAPFGAFSLAA